MNPFVVSGLVKRRAELAGEIERTRAALRKMVLDLETGRHILQFEPDFRVETNLSVHAAARRDSRDGARSTLWRRASSPPNRPGNCRSRKAFRLRVRLQRDV
jgi:hypothetical protein